MHTYYAFQDTPMGGVMMVRQDEVLTGLYWRVFKRIPQPATDWTEDASAFDDVTQQLNEYYAGQRQIFDLTVAAKGTEFQMDVWRELQKIPYGVSSNYQAIATAVGRPGAVRAVGTAIGSNPVSIVIPCHRVLTSSNQLGGYAGGLSAKLALLQTEGIR